MAVAYPLGLRTIIQASKRRTSPAAFRDIAPRRGMGYSQTIGTEPPVVWDVAFRFTRAEAQTFFTWFRCCTEGGRLEVILPIRTEFGLISYTARFLPDSLMQASESGEALEYTASILARAMVIPETAPGTESLTEAWPAGLPTFLRQSKRRRQDAQFVVSDWRSGFAHFEASGGDNPAVWDVELRFTRAQAALFMVWFRDVLDMGVLPFTAPIRTEYGAVPHTARFLPGGLLDCSESGEVVTYRATIAARRLSFPPGVPRTWLMSGGGAAQWLASVFDEESGEIIGTQPAEWLGDPCADCEE